MKLYLWERLGNVSHSYHAAGGLVVVAEDLNHAKVLASEYIEDPEWNYGTEDESPIVIDKDPDLVYEVGDVDARVIAFPDAGCC